jgi:hypothetical protein
MENISQWKIAETVYWEQVFPKGKEIQVRTNTVLLLATLQLSISGEWLNDRSVIPPASDKDTISKE